MTYNPESEIQQYLKRLSKAAGDLPRAQRRELLVEIEQHIRESLVEEGVKSKAEMLTLLDQLGDPDEIAAAARGPQAVPRSTAMEIWAIILLLVGGFLWGIGWIAGVVLLWNSSIWTLRDKLIGTLVVPGGLAAGMLLLVFGSASGGQTCTRSGLGSQTGTAGKAHVMPMIWHCTGGPSTLDSILMILLLAVLVIGPIGTAIYLGRRLNKEKRLYAGDPAAAVV